MSARADRARILFAEGALALIFLPLQHSITRPNDIDRSLLISALQLTHAVVALIGAREWEKIHTR